MKAHEKRFPEVKESGVGTVWYHQQGIANILSLAKIKQTHRVTFDSAADNVFHVYNKNGSKCSEFKQSKQGLYYTNLPSDATGLTNSSTIVTVAQNEQNFSLLDQRRALTARKLQNILNILTSDLVRAIDQGHLPNCPVNTSDVNTANKIYGPSLVSLKGKGTRRSDQHVRVNMLRCF